MIKYVASIGGGISSTFLLPVQMIRGLKIPKEEVDFVMCRLPNEDSDVFRLVKSVEELLGISIKMIGHNKTPFQVFFESKFLGNSRIDPCSRILKREVMRDYVQTNYSPGSVQISVGIGRSEIDRELSIRYNWHENGYKVIFPLDSVNGLTRTFQINECRRQFGFVPRLYLMGFSHNNCGGACIKSGKKEWARLWYFLPDVYAEWEKNEILFRQQHGGFTILREVIDGVKVKLTLTDFRLRLESLSLNQGVKEVAYLESFEENPYFRQLDDTPACQFCDAAG